MPRQLFDAILAKDFSLFESKLLDTKPSILVIYEDDFNFLTKMCLSHVREATFKMIKSAKSRNITVVVHSSDASDNPKTYLECGADFVVAGEGEQTLVETAKFIFGQFPHALEEIAGLYYLLEDNVVSTPIRKTLRRLDELPQPAWDLIDFKQYRAAWNLRHNMFSLNMVTTRGCPYKCNWCAKPIWGQQYHSHSPEYIAAQLAWLVENAAPDHIWFADDIFGLKKDWIESFSREVKRLNISVPFMIQSRADLIDRKISLALKNAGCDEVWLGVESGSQAILDKMDKDVQLAQVVSARKNLKEMKIKVGFFIQLGYPGEDLYELNQTRQLILNMQPEKIGVSVSYPLPGTKFHARVKNQLSAKTNWIESDDLDAVFEATFRSEFYRKIREHLHSELQGLASNDLKVDWSIKWKKLISSAEEYRTTKPTQLPSENCESLTREYREKHTTKIPELAIDVQSV